LHNLNITPANAKDAGGTLVMDATARTYRYLDAGEVEAQRKAVKPAGAKK
jgi:type IV pilus assembly protein PilO